MTADAWHPEPDRAAIDAAWRSGICLACNDSPPAKGSICQRCGRCVLPGGRGCCRCGE